MPRYLPVSNRCPLLHFKRPQIGRRALKGQLDRDAGVQQAAAGLGAHEGDFGQAAVGLARAIDASGADGNEHWAVIRLRRRLDSPGKAAGSRSRALSPAGRAGPGIWACRTPASPR